MECMDWKIFLKVLWWVGVSFWFVLNFFFIGMGVIGEVWLVILVVMDNMWFVIYILIIYILFKWENERERLENSFSYS